ncbi:uncharacterized protein LOC133467533 [Phyllopteryx taeniolatus]|uniref:uncharacterized protein LOC133467533 n=1 Tax=Phyllopteryx taeniolatus TaxID=161469 RepID=UPI002AD28898|nr:uncharacterized protein LOC133467533 [Phyllopteryx taeniolatus]
MGEKQLHLFFPLLPWTIKISGHDVFLHALNSRLCFCRNYATQFSLDGSGIPNEMPFCVTRRLQGQFRGDFRLSCLLTMTCCGTAKCLTQKLTQFPSIRTEDHGGGEKQGQRRKVKLHLAAKVLCTVMHGQQLFDSDNFILHTTRTNIMTFVTLGHLSHYGIQLYYATSVWKYFPKNETRSTVTCKICECIPKYNKSKTVCSGTRDETGSMKRKVSRTPTNYNNYISRHGVLYF